MPVRASMLFLRPQVLRRWPRLQIEVHCRRSLIAFTKDRDRGLLVQSLPPKRARLPARASIPTNVEKHSRPFRFPVSISIMTKSTKRPLVPDRIDVAHAQQRQTERRGTSSEQPIVKVSFVYDPFHECNLEMVPSFFMHETAF